MFAQIPAKNPPFNRVKTSIILHRIGAFLEPSGVKWTPNSRHFFPTADGQMRHEMRAESGFQNPHVTG